VVGVNLIMMNEFEKYLNDTGKRRGGKFSGKSIKSYCDDVQSFLNQYQKELSEVTEDDAYQFLMQGSPSTALRRFSSLKRFYEFAIQKEIVSKNLFIKELFNRLREKPKRISNYITEEEAKYLLKKCENNVKNYAIIYTFLNTGLRESEIINLSRNIQDGRIKVITKGDVERSIRINSGTEKALKAYLDTRDDNSPYMFVTKLYKNKYSVSGMYRLIRDLMGKAYIEKDAHPHTLRHTYANDIYNRTHDIFAVQKMLGHKNIRTTLEYVKTLPDARENQIQEESTFNVG
jgi:site-specific recombinase XerD